MPYAWTEREIETEINKYTRLLLNGEATPLLREGL